MNETRYGLLAIGAFALAAQLTLKALRLYDRLGLLPRTEVEFEVDGEIGVPVCGMTISNDRGVIVHGKNNLQYAEDAPSTSSRTRKVSCYQEIALDLAAGEYTFQIGLASASRADWNNRERIPYEAEMGFVSRICHISNVGSFSVRMGTRDGVTFLTHHGVADLPGGIRVRVE